MSIKPTLKRTPAPQPADAIDPIATITTYLETHRVKVCDGTLGPRHEQQQQAPGRIKTVDLSNPHEIAELRERGWRKIL